MRWPWKQREVAAKESAEKARDDYKQARAQRPQVEAVTRAIRQENRRNGWMEDLEKIIGSKA